MHLGDADEIGAPVNNAPSGPDSTVREVPSNTRLDRWINLDFFWEDDV